ncbi:MAG: NapC/NirT family cytochrome c [Melioribacteraceae bacterium]|nr:NapC/NirT family cytochrome c [Melioribacteraceae bacterium]
MKMKLPHSVYNWISLIGTTIAIISFFMIIFLFFVSVFIEHGGTYLGLIVYIILPAFLIFGLLLIPIGMYFKVRREKRGKATESTWPLINLNEVRQRNAVFVFAIGTTIFLFASAIGSYEAFHFTESNEFCGEICHAVMKPEYTAYQKSPHARVSCVDCHVGEGADWYVRSKMSGLYQVYAVTANVYPKPIPTPIKNLRPARETCERCHWPEKFYAHKLRHERHYLPDENNTEWDIYLTMRIGASQSALGLQEGIHWHINPDVKIEYVSLDDKREEIPWVRYTNLKTGDQVVFEDQNSPLDKDKLDTMIVRTMDCMDCHNRPSHNYKPPAFFINNGLTAGTIPKELPEIKSVAIDIVGEEYESTQEAMEAINKGIQEFYSDNYPDTDEKLILRAIEGLQREFSNNIFPEMKVRWDAYPNHIGHVEFNGCFRCHDNNHISHDEQVITQDCNSCHFITAQGTPGNLEYAVANGSLEFRHPENIDEVWKESLCTDCHTGLAP